MTIHASFTISPLFIGMGITILYLAAGLLVQSVMAGGIWIMDMEDVLFVLLWPLVLVASFLDWWSKTVLRLVKETFSLCRLIGQIISRTFRRLADRKARD